MEFKDFALGLGKRAAEIMRANFSQQMEKTWKEDDTPLTATDIAINKLVVESVAASFPDHDVLGEEESSEVRKAEYVWVCDPVDGTIPFSQGVPISTFSLALTKNGESIVAVVVDPFLDRTFYAEKGKGAFCNDQPIHVSTQKELAHSVIDVETWVSAQKHIPEIIDDLEHLAAKVSTFCSFVYPSVSVAQGNYLATIFTGRTPWDVAAVKLIVEEAGGKVTDLNGNEQRYDQKIYGAVVSNGLVHQTLLTLVQQRIDEKDRSTPTGHASGVA